MNQINKIHVFILFCLCLCAAILSSVLTRSQMYGRECSFAGGIRTELFQCRIPERFDNKSHAQLNRICVNLNGWYLIAANENSWTHNCND